MIGLDGVPPAFLYDRYLPRMPHVRELLARGARGALRTTDPPISVPAWPVMFTGVDPGTLGLYGFRHRRPGSYTEMSLPTSADVAVPTLWQILSERGRRVAVIGMPLGYPPLKLNGVYISDFLTPPGRTDTTQPPELREEIDRRFGPYVHDVIFRSDARGNLESELFEMTARRFEVAEWLYGREPWDVFAVHEIGSDRLHHAFWKHFDPDHPAYDPAGPFAGIAERYYTLLDDWIGRLLGQVDDQTMVLVVSDHGSMAMDGCFCINQWLAQEGFLSCRGDAPRPGSPLDAAGVDWRRTVAWSAGGYYARIFFNLRGREPEGTVTLAELPVVRDRLVQRLASVVKPSGERLRVRVLDPREIYAQVAGEAPDLIVYFDELRIRAAGTMGHPSLFLSSNDTGPDDAVHSFDGVLLAAGPGIPAGVTLPEMRIRDVTPTLLALLGEPIPAHVQGQPIQALLAPSPSAPLPVREPSVPA